MHVRCPECSLEFADGLLSWSRDGGVGHLGQAWELGVLVGGAQEADGALDGLPAGEKVPIGVKGFYRSGQRVEKGTFYCYVLRRDHTTSCQDVGRGGRRLMAVAVEFHN